nr:hypothetical protein [Saprospiraceae bacterium]
RFFIISNNEAIEFRDLKSEERTLEKYQSLGQEIINPNIITRVEEQIGQNISFREISSNGQEFKKMFVFGAAASSFCVFGEKFKDYRSSKLYSPLGVELFDEKYEQFYQRFPGAKHIIPSFEVKGRDIEACLEEEWQEYRGVYNPFIASNHINIQYYLRELFQAISEHITQQHFRNNLYSLFVNQLQKYLCHHPQERIGVVSFNYDTILDSYVQEAMRSNFHSMDDYIDWHRQKILLFKPHGSCNWGWRFQGKSDTKMPIKLTADDIYNNQFDLSTIFYELIGDITQTTARNSWGIEKSFHKNGLGRFTINKNLLEVASPDLNDHYFPALLLPYRDKDEFVMPYDHYFAMKHFMGEMEELYLIGWKGNEDLFNRQIQQHACKLKKIVIANPNSEEVRGHLSKYLDLDKYEIVESDTFETFVLNHLETALDQ